NVYNFYLLYADRIKEQKVISPAGSASGTSDNFLDKWILSKLNLLIKETTEVFDGYATAPAAEMIQNFFVNDLSTWYLRRSRDRIKGDNPAEQQAALQTLRTVLLTLVKLMAPAIPFLTEEMYKTLGGQLESVHLEDWPVTDESLIHSQVNEAMDQVLKIVELVHAARAEAGVKLRQPLADLEISNGSRISGDQLDLIKEEVNVKEIILPVEIKEKNGYLVKINEQIKIALNIELTDELKKEGLVREIVRQVNFLRKDRQLTITDQVELYYQTDDQEVNEVFDKFNKKIQAETLSSKIISGIPAKAEGQNFKINGKTLKIGFLVKN
ncbi:MAG TPA: class I tRNA ligase family protein, partial [Patescibacteria group bacterium]